MIASAGPDHYRQTIATLLATDEIDALVVMYIPVDASQKPVVFEAIAAGRAAGGGDKPMLACLMVEEGGPVPLQANHEQIPTYGFPEAAAHVLGKVAAYAQWRAQPLGLFLEFDDANPQVVRETCRQGLEMRGAGWLATEDTRQVLRAMGLPVAPGGVARTADEAAVRAKGIGFPVAVKLASHVIVHKTEMGGIFLHLQDEVEVRQAFEAIHQRLAQAGQREAMERVLVQPMVCGGVEVMVGVTADPVFGPLIAFGLGVST